MQINGKVRDKIEVKSGITQKESEKIVLKSEKIKTWITDAKKIEKVIYCPKCGKAYCTKCSASYSEGKYSCPGCGAKTKI